MEQKEIEAVLALLDGKEMHVRGISKMINQPHSTTSRTMKSLLKKNVVDFKMQGKNKTFRLKNSIEARNYIFMAEHFKLLKFFEKYQDMPAITEQILSRTGNKMAILFGSFAKFTAKKDSDIDVFVETQDKNIKKELEKINPKLSVKIGGFDKSNLLIKEIIKNHIIIKEVEHYYNKFFD